MSATPATPSRLEFHARNVGTLPCRTNAKGEPVRTEYRDAKTSGLSLRVSPDKKDEKGHLSRKGTRTFYYNYRIGPAVADKRRIVLGRFPGISLAKARKLAADVRFQVAQGHDPAVQKQDRRQEPTVAQGIDQFFSDYVPERQKKGKMADRTVKEYRRQADAYILPKLGKKRIRDVKKGDITKLLAPLPPIMANRTQALLSKLFNLFEDWEYRPQHSNPVRGIDKATEEARDKTFSEEELSALGVALDGMDGNPGAILAIRLAALTGLRIGEIQNIRWEDIDFETGALELPKTKTGRRVHSLPTAALELLAEAPRFGECVIAGRDPDTPLDYGSIRRHFGIACKAAGIRGARIHDLRRTVMTDAAALGVNAHLLRDMLGHKTTAMADRYIRQAGAPLKELRERMGQTMAAKLGGKASAGSGEP
jgi:integrase